MSIADIQRMLANMSPVKPGDDVVADFDEEANMVVITINGVPSEFMSPETFLEIRERLGLE